MESRFKTLAHPASGRKARLLSRIGAIEAAGLAFLVTNCWPYYIVRDLSGIQSEQLTGVVEALVWALILICRRRLGFGKERPDELGVWCFAGFFILWLLKFYSADNIAEFDKHKDVVAVLHCLIPFLFGSAWDGAGLKKTATYIFYSAALFALALTAFNLTVAPVGMYVRNQIFTSIYPINQAVQLSLGIIIGIVIRKEIHKWIYLSCMVLMCGQLVLTGSRGPLAGIFIATALYLVIGRGGIRKALYLSVATVVGVAILFTVADVLPNEIKKRIVNIDESLDKSAEEGGAEGRIVLYERAWDLIRERPITGWGPDANDEFQSYSHNMFIQLALETGLCGALFVLILVVVSLCMLLKRAKVTKEQSGQIALLLFVFYLAELQISYTPIKVTQLWLFLGFGCRAASWLARLKRTRTPRYVVLPGTRYVMTDSYS